jgi:hypothetical protein
MCVFVTIVYVVVGGVLSALAGEIVFRGLVGPWAISCAFLGIVTGAIAKPDCSADTQTHAETLSAHYLITELPESIVLATRVRVLVQFAVYPLVPLACAACGLVVAIYKLVGQVSASHSCWWAALLWLTLAVVLSAIVVSVLAFEWVLLRSRERIRIDRNGIPVRRFGKEVLLHTDRLRVVEKEDGDTCFSDAASGREFDLISGLESDVLGLALERQRTRSREEATEDNREGNPRASGDAMLNQERE